MALRKNYLTLALIIGNATCEGSAQDYHRYFTANYQQFKKKYNNSYQWYQLIIANNDKNHIHAYKGYISLLYQTGKFSGIISLIPTLDADFKEDIEIQLIFAEVLGRIGNRREANKRIMHLGKTHKTNHDIALQAAQLYLQRKEPENALTVIDDFLNNQSSRTHNFLLHYMKSRIYVQLNNKEKAYAEIQKSLTYNPQFDKSLLLLALLEEERGHINRAVTAYTNFLTVSKNPNTQVQKHLIKLATQQSALHMHKSVPCSSITLLEQTLAYMKQQQFSTALTTINQYLTTNKKHTKAKIAKIQILIALKDYGTAIQQIEKWIDEEPAKEIWFNILYQLSCLYPVYDQGIEILKILEMKNTSNWIPAFYLAHLYLHAKNDDKALHYLQKASTIVHDSAIKTKILLQIALVHRKTKKYDKMIPRLKETKQLDKKTTHTEKNTEKHAT